ncbi:FHA domain-containing protein [Mycetocola zhujimingii]|uniref:FHA domain-containing protein n=1 Tax=Mycetocola zhujimingii TaxID=2079792 RepID=UPI000D3C393F|nr:FHA domain-containing protein [Mycetocola zhujimingii]AWB88134.1 hypothetical protein C3E77_15265 [Mycetocola zhujimingii]
MLSRDEKLIPPYPVICVDMYSDGRAHINVAGRHVDYPAAELEATRAAVIAYAATVAEELGRPVRMAATDHNGTFTVGVHADGKVTDLTSESVKPSTLAVEDPALTTQLYTPGIPDARIVQARDEHPDEETHLVTVTAERWAVLAFSTGQRFTITTSALIGRHPTLRDGDQVHELITIDDASQTVSKTHFRVDWRSDILWATDYRSGNGTTLHRDNQSAEPLVPWEPQELQHGDVLLLGDVRLRVTLFGSDRTETSR